VVDTVILETTFGDIEIELDWDKAPITVENFLNYVSLAHYDGTVFHRVISDFMVQSGGFTEDGTQKKVLAPIKLESDNGLKNNRGTVAMARTMIPDSATSQFFINVKDNIFLNARPGVPGYAVFGYVTKGMDVVDKIRKVPTTTKHGMKDWPVDDIIIKKAILKEQQSI